MTIDRPEPFGRELRRRREAARLSLQALARKVHYSAGYLSKIENGHKPAPAALARQCDAVLGAGGELAALLGIELGVQVEAEEPAGVDLATLMGSDLATLVGSDVAASTVTGSAGRAVDELDGTWTVSLTPDGGGGFLPFDRPGRPDAVTLMGMEFAARGLTPAAQDEAVLLGFRAQFDELRRLGQCFSPSVVLPALIVLTRTVRALAERADGELRRWLFLLATRYAEFTGWMAQEAGDDRAAGWLTDLAVRMAVAGDDPHFGRYALVRRADLAMYRQDAASTVRLAMQAQADGSAPARVRAIGAVREAQGHALVGDHEACLGALDRASRLFELAAVETVPGPVLGSTNVQDPVATARAWCLYEVGRPLEAAAALDLVVDGLPPGARRARALWGSRRVLAYASAGEVDHACALTGPVLADVQIVESATARCDLRLLSRTLARWRSHQPVRELLPRLTETLRVTTR